MTAKPGVTNCKVPLEVFRALCNASAGNQFTALILHCMASPDGMIADLERAWRTLGFNDIGCGLYRHHSPNEPVTHLSGDIYLECQKIAGDVTMTEDVEWHAPHLRQRVVEVVSDIMSRGTQAYGPLLWPKRNVDELPSDDALASSAPSLTWSSVADRQVILDILAKITNLNLQHIHAHRLRRGESYQPNMAGSNTRRLTTQALITHAFQRLGLDTDLSFLQKPYQSTPDPGNVDCVKLLKTKPDTVYRFCTDDHDRHVEGRWSFSELMRQWRQATDEVKHDNGSFPDVRPVIRGRKEARSRFEDCVVQCICDDCRTGKAEQLECKRYKFDGGKEILVHHFSYHGRNWAFILGDFGSSPPVYLLWGAHEGDPKKITGYSEHYQVQERCTTEVAERPGKRSKEDRTYHHHPSGKRTRASRQCPSFKSTPSSQTQCGRTPDKQTKAPPTTSTGSLSLRTNETISVDADHETSHNESDQLYGQCQKRGRSTDLSADQGSKRRRTNSTRPPGNFSRFKRHNLSFARMTAHGTAERPTSMRGGGCFDYDDDEDSDEEEIIPSLFRVKGERKPTPTESTLRPILEAPLPEQQPQNHQQQQQQRQENLQPTPPTTTTFDFDTAYSAVRAHLASQVQPGNSRSLLFTDDKLREHMRELHSVKQDEDEWLFKQVCEMIDEELARDGMKKLPAL
ncbi:hypothetical protein Q7P37_002213 [Cladosporium fusiforme]